MTQQLNVAAILRMARAPVVRAPVAISASQIRGATPGCYAMHISDAEYHSTAPGVSSTGLKKLLRSPAHYRAYLEEKDDDTQSRRLGRAIHAWVLENHVFNDKFVVWRGGARRGKAFDTFEAANTGKTILTEADVLTVQGCGQALVNDPAFPVRGFLEGMQDSDGNQVVAPAKTEFSIFWTDEETGVQCKVRLDAVRLEEPVIALDLKSTDDARPHEFTRQMLRLDYDLQAAFYVEGVRRFVGHECPFIFAAVEIDKPHGTAFYALSPGHDMMENGRRKMRHALQIKARCERENRYPGYSFASVMEPAMAPWMAFEAPAADAAHLQAA
jgi:hypothetical protein